MGRRLQIIRAARDDNHGQCQEWVAHILGGASGAIDGRAPGADGAMHAAPGVGEAMRQGLADVVRSPLLRQLAAAGGCGRGPEEEPRPAFASRFCMASSCSLRACRTPTFSGEAGSSSASSSSNSSARSVDERVSYATGRR